MARFRMASGKATTPRIWPLQVLDYRGTFDFLNLRATNAQLTKEQTGVLRVLPKAEYGGTESSGSGTIHVSSVTSGELYIDGQDKGYILAGHTLDFEQQSAGVHSLEIRTGAATEVKEATLQGGGLIYLSFGLKSPIDESGSLPVGTLQVQSPQGFGGEVFLDSLSVGSVELNGTLAIHNVTAGHHEYRVVGSGQTEGAAVEVIPNVTTFSIPIPAAPRDVRVTVQ
jgi:hypothetical protein